MELTQKECLLTKILDCDIPDLELLETIHYDLDDIAEELIYNDNLSFNSLLENVFLKGIQDLTVSYLQKKDEIREEILYRIHEAFDEYILNQDMNYEELLKNEDYQKLLNDYEYINNEEFRPDIDYNLYLNHEDSHVQVNDMDFYRHYLEDDVKSIEYDIGCSFKNRNCKEYCPK